MDDELQEKCNGILDQNDVLEELKIEQVEALVQRAHGSTMNVDLERLVLDILWRHREGGQSSRAKKMVTAGFVDNSSLNDMINWVPVSDPDKLVLPKPLITKSNIVNRDKNITKNGNNSRAFSYEDWGSPEEQGPDKMSPFNILRSILGEKNLDEDIQNALEKSGFDIQLVLEQLMVGTEYGGPSIEVEQNGNQLNETNDTDDKEHDERERILCKYFVQSGECLRADCKYSHDLSSRICKFWLQGSCLAGDDCAFLHEIPPNVLDKWKVSEEPVIPARNIKLTSEDDFPVLGASAKNRKTKKKITTSNNPSWPALSTTQSTSDQSRKWNFNSAYFTPGSFVAMKTDSSKIPTVLPKLASSLTRKRVILTRPQKIPWEISDYENNKKYISFRNSAARHAELRNKCLQLAADSWRNNAAGTAKLLSKKGQDHNDNMIFEYEEAADLLFDQRKIRGSEIYLDLHGLDLEEVGGHLHKMLHQVEKEEDQLPRAVYIISGHGRYFNKDRITEDKLSKSVKDYLDRKGYSWTEYHTAEKKYGQIIAVDPWSHF